MKYVTGLAVSSLFLNIFVLYQLHSVTEAPSQIKETYAPSLNDDEVHATSNEHLLLGELGILKSRVQVLGDRLENIAGMKISSEPEDVAEDSVSNFDQQVYLVNVNKGQRSKSSHDSEDWFWNGDSGNGEEAYVASALAEDDSVNSLVCRSAWCRAEIQLDEDAGSVEAELELQAQLSESLGRDTTMQFGKREGGSQVVFIR